ncbi:glutamate racemase [Ilyomonas limi]|uniref:Glutamate racemase n=1 Tax=Ilyomonas limi TaxID=2575867 RepID=A0A4U3L116_9BACT|nr:glutamate racemase [Ilyomonas limi]TKK68540.1 glutamate racemase [Ilyomonas limi]
MLIYSSANPINTGAIGVFDSGYGGLTVLKEIVRKLPQYNYIYLGDNSRAPYGNRSFETVYHYTLQCVQWLFDQGCPLVILACNTASAKALRTIQQNDLPKIAPNKRVLGVIRPTSEIIGTYTKNNKVGILATKGTVQSQSYVIEINKFFPHVQVEQEACPMWVPLVENKEHESHGADYFIRKNVSELLKKDRDIDTILLACTHYPLLKKKIEEYVPVDVTILSQGEIVANSLADYLERHPEIEQQLAQFAHRRFYTTDDTADFDSQAETFFGEPVHSEHIDL